VIRLAIKTKDRAHLYAIKSAQLTRLTEHRGGIALDKSEYERPN